MSDFGFRVYLDAGVAMPRTGQSPRRHLGLYAAKDYSAVHDRRQRFDIFDLVHPASQEILRDDNHAGQIAGLDRSFDFVSWLPGVLFLTTERSPLALTDANCIERTEINVDHVTRAMVRLKPISQLRTPHDPSCSVQVCPAVDFAFGLQPDLPRTK